jgi:hypothetical protein
MSTRAQKLLLVGCVLVTFTTLAHWPLWMLIPTGDGLVASQLNTNDRQAFVELRAQFHRECERQHKLQAADLIDMIPPDALGKLVVRRDLLLTSAGYTGQVEAWRCHELAW